MSEQDGAKIIHDEQDDTSAHKREHQSCQSSNPENHVQDKGNSMELKEATFKTTEIGLIPEEWEIIRLGDILAFKNGLNKESKYFGYGTPIVNYMDVYANYGLSKNNIQGEVFVSSEEIKNFSAKKGDVFFTRTSETVDEIGISAVLLEDVQKCVFSGFVLRGRDKLNTLTLDFKKYCFSSHLVRKQIISRSTYTTRALTNGRHLSAVYIPIPKDQKEQKAIATALGNIDTLITNLDKLIAKKKAIKQGAMQRLLKSPAQGGQRLPGFEGEWRETNMGSVIDLLTGYPFSSSSYQEFGIRLLRGSNIKRGNTDWDESITQYWPEITPELKKFELKAGDIVIAMDGSLVGRSFAQLSSTDLPALLLQRVARIRSNSVDLNFLKELVCSDLFTKYCDSVKTVTAIPHISPDDIRNYPISFPPSKEEQQTIASILSDMDKEIESLERKKSKYLHIKQGKMQELLTGKTRLV